MSAFGLIGTPLTHSFSKRYFEEKFKQLGLYISTYNLFDIALEADLKVFKERNTQLTGLNVTIPYKRSVLPLLEEISDEARAVGAVNTIKIVNGYWYGYNTDVWGFELSLKKWLSQMPKSTVVLGNGGASKAVQYVLNKMNLPYVVVSRNPHGSEISYAELNESVMANSQLLLNTTPLGMYPNIDKMPYVNTNLFSNKLFVYDLIYNPEETLLLKEAKNKGCSTKNGLEMLHLQAEKSWEIWTGRE